MLPRDVRLMVNALAKVKCYCCADSTGLGARRSMTVGSFSKAANAANTTAAAVLRQADFLAEKKRFKEAAAAYAMAVKLDAGQALRIAQIAHVAVDLGGEGLERRVALEAKLDLVRRQLSERADRVDT